MATNYKLRTLKTTGLYYYHYLQSHVIIIIHFYVVFSTSRRVQHYMAILLTLCSSTAPCKGHPNQWACTLRCHFLQPLPRFSLACLSEFSHQCVRQMPWQSGHTSPHLMWLNHLRHLLEMAAASRSEISSFWIVQLWRCCSIFLHVHDITIWSSPVLFLMSLCRSAFLN